MTLDCGKFELVANNASCYDIAAANGDSLSDFYSWNPALNGDCSGLYPGYYVCVNLLSTATQTATTASTTESATPTPTQNGMVRDCNKFYFVKKDDGCSAVASAEGISLADLDEWNPALGADCSGLWPEYYICVGVSNTLTTTATSTKSTSTVVGSTPTPTQSGMTSGCKGFYLVKSGDGCYDIATSNGITLDQFYAYNPGVGNDCSGLWPNYYVCIGK